MTTVNVFGFDMDVVENPAVDDGIVLVDVEMVGRQARFRITQDEIENEPLYFLNPRYLGFYRP